MTVIISRWEDRRISYCRRFSPLHFTTATSPLHPWIQTRNPLAPISILSRLHPPDRLRVAILRHLIDDPRRPWAPSRFAELHVSVAQHLRISSEKRVCGCGQMKRECGCPRCLVRLQDRHRAVKTWRRSRRVTGYSRGENTVIPIVEEHKRELSRGVCGDKRWSVLRIEPVRWIIPPNQREITLIAQFP